MLVSVLGAENTTEQDIFPDFTNCTCNQKWQNTKQRDKYSQGCTECSASIFERHLL